MSKPTRLSIVLGVGLVGLTVLRQQGGSVVSTFPDLVALGVSMALVFVCVGAAYPYLEGPTWQRALRVTWIPALLTGMAQVGLVIYWLNPSFLLMVSSFLMGTAAVVLVGQLSAVVLDVRRRVHTWYLGRA